MEKSKALGPPWCGAQEATRRAQEMVDHKPRVMLFLCHRISPMATSDPATPPDASHVPAPPCNPARAHPSHQIPEHVPELSGKREVTNVILQASSAGTFREFSSPVPTHRAPNVPGDLAHAARLQLLFINCFGCFYKLFWSMCLASLTTEAEPSPPQPPEPALSCNKAFPTCV